MIKNATPQALQQLDITISEQLIECQKQKLTPEQIQKVIAPLKMKRDLLAMATNYKDLWDLGAKDIAKGAYAYIKQRFL